MKPTLASTLIIPFLALSASAAPGARFQSPNNTNTNTATLTSTLSIIPFPLATTGTNGTTPFPPTNTSTPSTAPSLSLTLSYPTTLAPTPTPTTTIPPSSTGLPPLPCTLNALYCNSPTSFSLCAPDVGPAGTTRYVFMGATAAGTICTTTGADGTGAIGRANSGACADDGAVVCKADGLGFYLCDQGGLVDMGAVAAGTVCRDGGIVGA